MPNVGPMELIIVLVIALLVLGPKRLPDAGKSLGKGIREFKDSIAGNSKDDLDLEAAAQSHAQAQPQPVSTVKQPTV